VITFGINGFRRRVDPMGRIIGDDCFEISRSRSGSALINWRESQDIRIARITPQKRRFLRGYAGTGKLAAKVL
jgi:hypothetical protein